MKKLKRYTAFIVLAIAAILLIACASLTVYSFRQLVAANRQGADSHEAVYHLQRAISALKDVRGGARAVMLTGDARNGPDFSPAVRAVYAEVAQMREHLGNDSDLMQLERMMDGFVIRSQNIVAGGQIPADRLPATVAEEKRLIAEIAKHAGNIENRENAKLDADDAALTAHTKVSLVVGAIAAMATIVLMTLTVVALRSQIIQRARAQRTIAASHEELSSRVVEL